MLLALLPAAAPACGWWGDAEHAGTTQAVTVDPLGRPRIPAADSERAERLEDLVLTANRFRAGDRLPRDPVLAIKRYRMAAQGVERAARVLDEAGRENAERRLRERKAAP